MNEENVINISTAIEKYVDRLDENQIKALPLIAYGMASHNVAKQLNLPHNTILMWIRADHVFREALAIFKRYQEDYHRQKLNLVGALAWSKLENILTAEFDINDKDNRKLQMDAAKHVTGMLPLKDEKIQIEHKFSDDNLEQSSIDILTKRLAKKSDDDDIVEAKYTVSVLDIENPENTATSMQTAEKVGQQYGLPDEMKQIEYFKYILSPDTRPGFMNFNEETRRWQCHICGGWFKDMVVHVRNDHQMSIARYREMYQIPKDYKFVIDELVEATEEEIESLTN